MTGEKNLETLLATLSPTLNDGEYVFCSFKNAMYGDYSDLKPIASFSESKGLTLIISKIEADEKGLTYNGVFKVITLRVHSSLEAIGLTAAFSKKLTEHGVSANVVAGYYHDHIFVKTEQAEKAIVALNEFSR